MKTPILERPPTQTADFPTKHDVKAMSAGRLKVAVADRTGASRRPQSAHSQRRGYAQGFSDEQKCGREERLRSAAAVARAAGMSRLSLSESTRDKIEPAFRALINIFHTDHKNVWDERFARDLIEREVL
jgi:hypothetical protein